MYLTCDSIDINARPDEAKVIQTGNLGIGVRINVNTTAESWKLIYLSSGSTENYLLCRYSFRQAHGGDI
jgi:hypothetical protein